MLKDEEGGCTEEEEEETDRLQWRIDYQELFMSKLIAYKQEFDGKIEYASAEFESLEERTTKLTKSFGLDPAIVQPKDMFSLFYNFAKDFSDSYKKMLT